MSYCTACLEQAKITRLDRW